MSGTITFRTIVNVVNGSYRNNCDSKSISITQSNLGAYTNIVRLGTGAPEYITPTNITTLGVCYMKNVDPSGYSITVGVSGGGQFNPISTLESGQPLAFPLHTGVILMGQSAGSGEASLDVAIYEK